MTKSYDAFVVSETVDVASVVVAAVRAETMPVWTVPITIRLIRGTPAAENAIVCVFIRGRGYMLIEAARVDQPYLRNNRCGVLLADQPDGRQLTEKRMAILARFRCKCRHMQN